MKTAYFMKKKWTRFGEIVKNGLNLFRMATILKKWLKLYKMAQS